VKEAFQLIKRAMGYLGGGLETYYLDNLIESRGGLMNKTKARLLTAEIRRYLKLYSEHGNPTVRIPKEHIRLLCNVVEEDIERKWWQI